MFLIRQTSSAGPYTNVAVVPGTSTPVSTNSIHAEIFGFLIKINSAKQVAMVRHGDGRHTVILHLLKEWSELVGPIKEAILRVKMEVNEF